MIKNKRFVIKKLILLRQGSGGQGWKMLGKGLQSMLSKNRWEENFNKKESKFDCFGREKGKRSPDKRSQ